MIKILLVDDHPLVRAGLDSLLSGTKGLQVVAHATSGEEAIKFVKELNPDVIIMDIQMPGIGGLEATRKILRYDADAKILILTVCEQEPFPSRLLEVGATGYVSKGCNVQEMLTAIRTVHSGQRYISPVIAQRLILKRFSEAKSLTEVLSERELQVMLMVVKGKKIQEMAGQLFLSTKTINSYRYRIFEKLNVKNDVELTLLAIRLGLIHPETTGVS